MAVFQKDPQVLITHPRPDVKTLADMKGKPIMISDAATVAFWPWLKAKYGFADTQIRKYTFNLAPFLVDPKRDPGRLSHQRALHDRADRRISSRKCSCSPTMAIPATPTWCWCRRDGSTATTRRCRRSYDATRDGWRIYLYGDPRPANALIKRDNPDMTDAIIAQAIAKMKTYGLVIPAMPKPSASAR